MNIRVTDTAIDPEDLERCRQLTREQVAPAFEEIAGCRGIEIHVRIDERHGGLVEVAAVSRWESVEAMEAAVRSETYSDAMADIRGLFQQAPIVRIFDTGSD